MREKIVRCNIFLCIFGNVLCKRKTMMATTQICPKTPSNCKRESIGKFKWWTSEKTSDIVWKISDPEAKGDIWRFSARWRTSSICKIYSRSQGNSREIRSCGSKSSNLRLQKQMSGWTRSRIGHLWDGLYSSPHEQCSDLDGHWQGNDRKAGWPAVQLP